MELLHEDLQGAIVTSEVKKEKENDCNESKDGNWPQYFKKSNGNFRTETYI